MITSIWADQKILICEHVEGRKNEVIYSYHLPLEMNKVGYLKYASGNPDEEFWVSSIRPMGNQGDGNPFLTRFTITWGGKPDGTSDIGWKPGQKEEVTVRWKTMKFYRNLSSRIYHCRYP